jgi:uncharacterized protein YdeI (YjbR/CyaY-like superfamily)
LEPTFFETTTKLRAWLKKHHRLATELWVGFYKKESGQPSISWPQSVDEALCFGWIDGIRKSIDKTRYQIRFSPRKPGSIWSAVNIGRVAELLESGRMMPAGLQAFERRRENHIGRYSYEQRSDRLEEAYEAKVKSNPKAWQFWSAQPPSYRKASAWWVVSAKKEETRLRRLEQLIDLSAREQRIPQFTRKAN